MALLSVAESAGAVPLPTELLVPRVEGTTWEGKGPTDDFTVYTFEKGGVLCYSYNKATYRNGTWKQEGDKVYFETNNRFLEFQGTVKRDELSGRWWNVRDAKGELRLKPKSPGKDK